MVAPTSLDSFLASPEQVHRVEDERSGLDAVVVIHNRTLGPAFGGIRFRDYPSHDEAYQDALGLAGQMTLKCAFAEMAAGGGKGVVRTNDLVDRPRACRILGDFVESLAGAFLTAGDLGTTAEDLRILAERSAYVADASRLGGLGEASAIGLIAAMRGLLPRLGKKSISHLRVVVQGLGSIGGALVQQLVAQGCHPVVVDVDTERLASIARSYDVELAGDVDPILLDADVFAPCAMGGILDERSATRIGAKAVVGGANRILATSAAGEILWRRGVLYAPDFAVNAGAVIRGGGYFLGAAEDAKDDPISRIEPRIASLFEEAFARDLPPETIAIERALSRVC